MDGCQYNKDYNVFCVPSDASVDVAGKVGMTIVRYW